MVKFKDLKIGMEIKVIKNIGSHNYIMHEVYKITYMASLNNITASTLDGTWGGNSLTIEEIEIVIQTMEGVKEKMVELEATYNKEMKVLKSKVDYMLAAGIEEYNSNQYRAYEALSLIDNDDLSLAEKAKILGDLISNQ